MIKRSSPDKNPKNKSTQNPVSKWGHHFSLLLNPKLIGKKSKLFWDDKVAHNIEQFGQEKHFLIWFLALLIGVTAACLALLFRSAISAVQYLWLGSTSEDIPSVIDQINPLFIFFAPIVGGIIVGQLNMRCMPTRRAQSVADVIEAKAIHDCQIDPKSGFFSAIISAISLGAGASAGREGPVVHLGAAFASWLERYMDLSLSARRTLLAAGVAAAVSASFNAPIAGVLFAHEVILAHYAMSAFVPVVIASVAGTIIARLTIGAFPAFIIPSYSITSYWEFPAFFLLGLTAAAVAIIFQLVIFATERGISELHLPVWLRPILGGILIGSIALVFPQILGVGYGTTDAALKQQLPLILLLALIFVKTAATAITFACRFGGGIFSPALYLGAVTGGAFGIIAAMIFPEAASSHGLYAIVGMGAVSAAVLGAPISTTLIVFELTGGFEIAIALLVAVSVASSLNSAVLGHSFFHSQLHDRGLFLEEGPHQEIAQTLRVTNLYTRLPPEGEERGGPIEVDQCEYYLKEDETIEKALRVFHQSGESKLMVFCAIQEGRHLGWASHVELLKAYNKALIEAHVEEHH